MKHAEFFGVRPSLMFWVALAMLLGQMAAHGPLTSIWFWAIVLAMYTELARFKFLEMAAHRRRVLDALRSGDAENVKLMAMQALRESID